jgi:hypothetical protein
MRTTLAAVVLLFALSATAGTITSIDNPTIPVKGGEYFMTVTGTDLGTEFVYDGPSGRTVIDVTSDNGLGTSAVAWIPQEVINTPGTYSLTITGRNGVSGPVTFRVLKPGLPDLTLHLPEVLVAYAKTRAGAGIKYEVSVTGGEGTPEVGCDPGSGSVFPFGTSWIKCFAVDQSGRRATGEIQVNVSDIVPPVLKVPQSFELSSEDDRGAYLKFDVSAFDEIDGEVKPVCLPESGAFIPNGRTTVKCSAEDASLNPASAAFEVMVQPRDTGKLQLSVPSETIAYSGENKLGTFVEYKVEAYGSADPDPVIDCAPASGDFFEVGETKVVCTAVDDFDQRAEAAFVVTVKEGDGFRLADVSAEASSPAGANVTYELDRPEGAQSLQCSHESGALFPMGITTVECHSGTARGSFTVNVSDTIAPHIASVRTTPDAADAEQRIPVRVEVNAFDVADAMPRCSVMSIDGGDGRLTSELSVSLRPALDAATEVRLQVSCIDRAGNRAFESVPVRIGPASRRRAISN